MQDTKQKEMHTSMLPLVNKGELVVEADDAAEVFSVAAI